MKSPALSLARLTSTEPSSMILSHIVSLFLSIPLNSSRPFDESAKRAPAARDISVPFLPFVPGTVTEFTFFIILLERLATIFFGAEPSVSEAFAAANAIAIGSVQPKAGINSFFIISIYSLLLHINYPY